MGIMFLLGLPLPYTELSDVWTLRRRRSQLYVDFGGFGRTGIGQLGRFGIFLLPDGPIKSLAYLMAVGSLDEYADQHHPLMRFDGYYILADWVRIPIFNPAQFSEMENA